MMNPTLRRVSDDKKILPLNEPKEKNQNESKIIPGDNTKKNLENETIFFRNHETFNVDTFYKRIFLMNENGNHIFFDLR
jgi:hypothetical protein